MPTLECAGRQPFGAAACALATLGLVIIKSEFARHGRCVARTTEVLEKKRVQDRLAIRGRKAEILRKAKTDSGGTMRVARGVAFPEVERHAQPGDDGPE
ncbi:MAG: hypothetical protein ACREL7_13845 [Longimicrobiales bacterium]